MLKPAFPEWAFLTACYVRNMMKVGLSWGSDFSCNDRSIAVPHRRVAKPARDAASPLSRTIRIQTDVVLLPARIAAHLAEPFQPLEHIFGEPRSGIAVDLIRVQPRAKSFNHLQRVPLD